MSGPKVVRIVTRGELLAFCEGILARLDAAVEEWIKIGRRNDTLTEAEVPLLVVGNRTFGVCCRGIDSWSCKSRSLPRSTF